MKAQEPNAESIESVYETIQELDADNLLVPSDNLNAVITDLIRS